MAVAGGGDALEAHHVAQPLLHQRRRQPVALALAPRDARLSQQPCRRRSASPVPGDQHGGERSALSSLRNARMSSRMKRASAARRRRRIRCPPPEGARCSGEELARIAFALFFAPRARPVASRRSSSPPSWGTDRPACFAVIRRPVLGHVHAPCRARRRSGHDAHVVATFVALLARQRREQRSACHLRAPPAEGEAPQIALRPREAVDEATAPPRVLGGRSWRKSVQRGEHRQRRRGGHDPPRASRWCCRTPRRELARSSAVCAAERTQRVVVGKLSIVYAPARQCAARRRRGAILEHATRPRRRHTVALTFGSLLFAVHRARSGMPRYRRRGIARHPSEPSRSPVVVIA